MTEQPQGDALPEGLFERTDFAPDAAPAPVGGVQAPRVAELLTTGGGRVHLPIEYDEAGNIKDVSIMAASAQSGLTIPGNSQFWVDGAIVDPNTTMIRPGMVITAVGNVKGGR